MNIFDCWLIWIITHFHWKFCDIMRQAMWLLTVGLKTYVWILTSMWSYTIHWDFGFLYLHMEDNTTSALFVYCTGWGVHIDYRDIFLLNQNICAFVVGKLWATWLICFYNNGEFYSCNNNGHSWYEYRT